MTVTGLKNISERDRTIIEQGDDAFVPFSWETLKEIITKEQLSRLSRKPSDLLVYLQCKQRYEQEYGGVLPFIIKERLHWAQDPETGIIHPKHQKFLGDPEDIKILYNDFPYGVEDGIVHVVVWSRAKIPTQLPKGDLTPESHEQIDGYIRATFEKWLGVPPQDILWFKNWIALQSVRALDHFHVLLHNPPREKLDKLIGTSGPSIAYQS